MTTETWSALGTGVDGEVLAIAIHGGLVYVGGSFGHAGPDVNDPHRCMGWEHMVGLRCWSEWNGSHSRHER